MEGIAEMTTYTDQGCGGAVSCGSAPDACYHPALGGIITGPPAAAKVDLAACAAWQTWAGADYLDHIHVVGQGRHNPCAFSTPFATIMVTDDHTTLNIATGAFTKGQMYLRFQDLTPITYYDDPESAFNYFGNNVEQVLQQFFPFSSNSTLVKRNLTTVQAPKSNQQTDTEFYYTALYAFDYGPDT